MLANVNKVGLNLLKKNSVKSDFNGGVCATDGVAYTWEYLSFGTWAFNATGEADGSFSFAIVQSDFAKICKGKNKVVEFRPDEKDGGYYADGYPYIADNGSAIEAISVNIQEGDSVYKGKWNLPSRDRVIGATGVKEPKRALQYVCWNLQTGNFYACDTRLLARDTLLPLSVGVEWLFLPPKMLNYFTDDEVEIFANEKFVIIEQGSVRVVIDKEANSGMDKPPRFDAVIPKSRKLRGQMAISAEWLLQKLQGCRNDYIRIALGEDGAVRLFDLELYSKNEVEIATDKEYILHNANLEGNCNDGVIYNRSHLQAVCKFATEDFILFDIPETEKIPATDKVPEYESYPFAKAAGLFHTGGDSLCVLMARID